MTKQEVHTCDRCGEEFKIPLESYSTINYSINGDSVLEDFELCFKCRESFQKWLDGDRKT